MHIETVFAAILFTSFALVHVLINSFSHIKGFKDEYEQAWVLDAKKIHFFTQRIYIHIFVLNLFLATRIDFLKLILNYVEVNHLILPGVF